MKVSPFLLFIFATHFLVFLASKITLTFISVGMIFPVILLTVLILKNLPKKISFILLVLIVGHNILKITGTKESIFKVQPGMHLADEIRVIKRTYEIADGREFSINTLTIPYQYPTLWAYLYKLNGQKMPYYRGITAYDFAGRKNLISSDESRPIEFLITEPEINLPVKEPSGNRKLIGTEKIGGFVLSSFVPLTENDR